MGSQLLPCVIYARVSTKEQQTEGYSIPAQLKAIRAFCELQGLSPVEEFIEAESAGKAGRKRFSEMVAYLSVNRHVKVVVAHKLDRLYRNFRDQITLEDLGVRARYVVGDIPDTPQGELLRDVNLSVAKFYLGNLREEVRKGMDEKVAQGGWPHMAPTGYLNDRKTRMLVVDPVAAPLVRFAFERYSSGAVSLSMLSDELFAKGFRSRSGKRMAVGALHTLLKNPTYYGVIRYKGALFAGNHEPIITRELFDAVAGVFEPNRNSSKTAKHTFALRDYLVCSECGCKITAENQKGHVYYRCTHGKGRQVCSQRKYTREEVLMQQVEEILSSIEVTPDIVDMLVRDAAALDAQEQTDGSSEVRRLSHAITELDGKASKLLDGYLEGVVPAEAYRSKSDQIASERRAFEQRLSELGSGVRSTTAQVEALANVAAGARLRFAEADTLGKRKVLKTVLLNASVEGGDIVSYQLKRPFEYLRRDPSGAFYHPWWAIRDTLQTLEARSWLASATLPTAAIVS
jgi:site-specific DNA recombinase